MALPVNVATCTVTGTFVTLDGTAATGTVTFTPCPARILDAGATPPTTIIGTPITAPVTAGALSVDLPATDDTDLNPTDWAYHVAVRLGAHAAYSFCMYAPEGVVDLADVTPIIGTTGDAITSGQPGPPGDPGEGVPTGGSSGEVLAKISSSDFDTAWVPASAPGAHASTHAAGSTDPVTVTEAQVTGLVADLAAKQPLDADLTAIAALNPSSDTIIQRKVGMWVASTPTEYKDDLNLTKSDVGLGNVTNTSDAAKPVSTAQQTALDLKADKATTITPTAPLTGGGSLAANRTLAVSTFTSSTSGVVPASGGASTDFLRADGTWAAPAGGGGGGITTEDAVDAVATALVEGTGIDIAYDDTANTITVTADKTEMSLTKSDVGLSNVDNTADASKPVSTAQAAADALKADKTTAVTATAPITGTGTLAAALTIGIDDFTTSARGAVPTPGGTSTGRYLKDDGTWALPPSAVSAASGVFPFTYNTSTLESISGSQLRGNNSTFASSTKLWIAELTADGLNVAVGLGRIKLGHQVYIQDYTDASRWVLFNNTADSLDKGTYWELTVAAASSAGTIPGGKIALQSLSPSQAGLLFSTSTTAPGMTPGSNGATTLFLRGDQTWAAPSAPAAASETVSGIVELATAAEVLTGTDTTRAVTAAGATGAFAPKLVTINAQTGTTYTLVLADSSKLVTLTNAAAITLTVPTNASVAYPTGTQIDLAQLGAGQVTVAGSGGVTVNATPGLKCRAQYAAATLTKYATDTWLLVGDLSA